MAESVSVVIPFYRDDRWFPAALASVLGQDRPPDEIVVVDDASPLGTAAALDRVPAHVQVVRLTRNGGQGRARQVGTEAATSTLVSYLDSDDSWSPDFLVRCLEYLAHNPDCQAVYAPIAKRWPDGTMTAFRDKPKRLDVREAIVRFHAHPALSMVFRRSALLAIGGWDTNRRTVEDWDLMVRFLDRFGPIHLVTGPLNEYRIGHASGRMNSMGWEKLRRWYHTAWRNRELLERHYGRGAHRRRFVQAIRDRADRIGGVTGMTMRLCGRMLGTPLDVANPSEQVA